MSHDASNKSVGAAIVRILLSFIVILLRIIVVCLVPEHPDNVHGVHFWVFGFGTVTVAAVVGVHFAVTKFAARCVFVDVCFCYRHVAPLGQQEASARFGAACRQ